MVIKRLSGADSSSSSKRLAPAAERYPQLVALGKSSYVTQSGINKLLRAVAADGTPEAFSRASQYRARKNLCSTETEYGCFVNTVGLECTRKIRGQVETTTEQIGFQNPLAFFHHHCSHSPDYAAIVRAALEKHPCAPISPWHIIIYQDGIDPSDGLSKNHSRKSTAFYWSFLELGPEALCQEQVWGTVTTMRAMLITALTGGYARITEEVLNQFFGDVHDIRRSGVRITLAGEPDRYHTIVAVTGCLFGDEPALKEMTDCKGHQGQKPCLLCKNGCLHNGVAGAPSLHEHSDYLVSIATIDFNKFDLHTDITLRDTVSRLRTYHQTLHNDEYAHRSMLLGFNHNPHSIILNPRFDLNIASIVMFDWGHVYVANGLADGEFGMFMKVMQKSSRVTTYTECAKYVETFTLPKDRASLDELFTSERNKQFEERGVQVLFQRVPGTCADPMALLGQRCRSARCGHGGRAVDDGGVDCPHSFASSPDWRGDAHRPRGCHQCTFGVVHCSVWGESHEAQTPLCASSPRHVEKVRHFALCVNS